MLKSSLTEPSHKLFNSVASGMKQNKQHTRIELTLQKERDEQISFLLVTMN